MKSIRIRLKKFTFYFDEKVSDDVKEELRRQTGAQILSTGIGDRVSVDFFSLGNAIIVKSFLNVIFFILCNKLN